MRWRSGVMEISVAEGWVWRTEKPCSRQVDAQAPPATESARTGPRRAGCAWVAGRARRKGCHESPAPFRATAKRFRSTAFMEKLMQLPERVRSYFQHPCMQY